MTEKGERPDQPDLTVLSPHPAIGRVWYIIPAQASTIAGTGRRVGQHWVHPPPILGCQQSRNHYGGGPQWRGGVQLPPAGHTNQSEEGNYQGLVHTRHYQGPQPHCIGVLNTVS